MAPQIDGFHSGEIVEGTVTAVTPEEVTLELPTGRVAVISNRHFTHDPAANPAESVSVGDRLEGAVLVREDRENRIVLSRTWALKLKAWAAIDQSRANDAGLEGKVTEVIKGGVIVDIGVRAFLPASQVDVRHVKDLASYIGQSVTVKVTEIDRDRDKVVVSRRAWLKHLEKQAAKDLLAQLAVGQVRSGRISGLTEFGAFVELGGVRGLLHVSEMSWKRISDPSEVVSPGQKVEVKIIGLKKGGKRISLSLRALEPDPMKAINVGEILYGTVTRLADFGAFVAVAGGAEGLVHISELSEYRIDMPEEVVMPGDQVVVKIIGIDRKKHRIDLSVTQAMAASLDPAGLPTPPPAEAVEVVTPTPELPPTAPAVAEPETGAESETVAEPDAAASGPVEETVAAAPADSDPAPNGASPAAQTEPADQTEPASPAGG